MREFGDDLVIVGADEFDCAGFEGFRALGGVTHDKDRFAEAGSFFLNAAGVCKDDRCLTHKEYEAEVLERLDEEEIVKA